jgi:hypothetical protein
MRHFALVLLILVALPATANAPVARMRFKCVDDKMLLEFTATKAGTFYFETPSSLCGPSI